jgi:RHH-type proline utilization regulon transcriptional repressor/proline dehydrogenase/delta 1-pyrroline-5-carboxylate dehydrogenase
LFTLPAFADDPASHALRRLSRQDESERVRELLDAYERFRPRLDGAESEAARLIERIREKQHYSAGINALLNQYSLSSKEGVVLMCLAEALLRVPDRSTADRLIRDKLGEGNWRSHVGKSRSMFVNASSWGLLLTGKFIEFREEDAASAWSTLKQTVGRVGEPAIRASMRLAMKIMGTQFVLGRDIDEAQERAAAWRERGYRYSFDMLGEGARSEQDARHYFEAYVHAIDAIGRHDGAGRNPIEACGVSIKLSAIFPRFEIAQLDRVREELAPRLLELAQRAREYNIGLTIDAEEADRAEAALAVFERVYADPSLGDYEGLGMVVQAYLKSATAMIDWLGEQQAAHGRRIMVRLVKGAYWDAEIKHAQSLGHEAYPVFTRKASSDVSFLVCAERLLARRDAFYPQFATHNAHSAAAVARLAGDAAGFEFQRLHGMGEELFEEMLEERGLQVPCRIYAPVGVHHDLLAYLVRRLLENGANSSFVNNIADDRVPAAVIGADPAQRLASLQHLQNPGIPRPTELFGGERLLAHGDDLADPDDLLALQEAVADWQPGLVVDADESGGTLAVTNPARRADLVGHYRPSTPQDMRAALDRSQQAFLAWSAQPASARADALRRAADLYERHRATLIAYCVREAGKTIADALADVREAVDFLRYYAVEAESLEARWGQETEARGPVLCISPWNFPIAIFTGQLAAALAVGNTVLAKPAEQTTLGALFAVGLLHEAGVPRDVLQTLLGPGEPVGDTLLGDPRIRAVMFTGSTEVARLIARRLAAREDAPVPLIAETGGLNTLVVDSTALPEQVVDDVISSGFNSAGQRCSALRLLLVQEEIADGLVEMLTGAMAELRIGDPAALSTDVGPVIDEESRERLERHAAGMDRQARLLYRCELPEDCRDGSFVAPRLYELERPEQLEQEVFGPIVHLCRFRAAELHDLAERINASGYGLTFGVHSRIEDTVELLAGQVDVGNVYVNRNIIGAVVGVQPFGGHGLSGTGPKAGGPLYLRRLVQPRVQRAEASPLDEAEPAPGGGLPPDESLWVPLRQGLSDWLLSDADTRLRCLQRLQQSVGQRGDLDEGQRTRLAEALGSLELQQRELARTWTLPGPTGESNTLEFLPRGLVAVLGDAATPLEALLWTAVAALLAGNAVLLAGSADREPDRLKIRNLLGEAGFPDAASALLPAAEHLEPLLWQAPIAAVATPSRGLAARAARGLAARPGALLPVIDEPIGPTFLARFVLEKCVSINVTASGGNAALMSQGETD